MKEENKDIWEEYMEPFTSFIESKKYYVKINNDIIALFEEDFSYKKKLKSINYVANGIDSYEYRIRAIMDSIVIGKSVNDISNKKLRKTIKEIIYFSYKSKQKEDLIKSIKWRKENREKRIMKNKHIEEKFIELSKKYQ